MIKRKTKFLVIGAGVTGLGFVNFINSEDYLVVEKENEPGGFCRTIYKNGFTWDYAGHFFHFANEELKGFFNEKINKDEIIHKQKNTKIYYKGRYIDYPFQKNIHQLPKSEFIDCLYDLFNKREKDKYESFEEMLYGKFGESITEKFLKPYNEKLYACDLNKLDSNAMGRFFPYADYKEIINNMKLNEDTSYNNQFLYPKKGAITFINALLEDLDENKILYNQKIDSIDIKSRIVKTDTMEISYEYLINTIPLDMLIKYIDEREYIDNHNKLTYNKVLVFNLGFNKKSDINDIHWVYVPDKDINFYRVGFYDNILDEDKLSMYIEIGFSPGQDISVEEELSKTLDNLKSMKIINDHILEAYSSILMDPAYVHVSEKAKNIRDIKKVFLEDNNIYTIGRYGDWKYCSIEDSIIDSKNLANKFNSK